ncbi:hypothetical protein ACVIW3_007476 [Bradyrhizobium diazoefficiens]
MQAWKNAPKKWEGAVKLMVIVSIFGCWEARAPVYRRTA